MANFDQFRMSQLNALKWRKLADRRIDYLVALHNSESWKRYYTEEELLTEMRKAKRTRELWDNFIMEENSKAAAVRTDRAA